MPNVPAKLRVLGVVKLLNVVSCIVVYYHYVLGVDVFLDYLSAARVLFAYILSSDRWVKSILYDVMEYHPFDA